MVIRWTALQLSMTGQKNEKFFMAFDKLGEADVLVSTMKEWIERIPALVRGYKLENMWNMDELGVFFKIFPDKGLMEKAKSKNGRIKNKVRLTAAFFVNADRQKVDEAVMIQKNKDRDLSRPLGVHCLSNKKAWMNSEIMSSIERP